MRDRAGPPGGRAPSTSTASPSSPGRRRPTGSSCTSTSTPPGLPHHVELPWSVAQSTPGRVLLGPAGPPRARLPPRGRRPMAAVRPDPLARTVRCPPPAGTPWPAGPVSSRASTSGGTGSTDDGRSWPTALEAGWSDAEYVDVPDPSGRRAPGVRGRAGWPRRHRSPPLGRVVRLVARGPRPVPARRGRPRRLAGRGGGRRLAGGAGQGRRPGRPGRRGRSGRRRTVPPGPGRRARPVAPGGWAASARGSRWATSRACTASTWTWSWSWAWPRAGTRPATGTTRCCPTTS